MVTALAYALAGAVLWRLGGSVNTLWRRIGIPVLVLTTPFLGLTHFWYAFFASVVLAITTTLPITLRGDDIKDNYFWIPILGALYGVSIAILHWVWWPIPVVSVVYFGLVVLSSKVIWFKWEWFELIFGALYGAVLCVLHVT